MNLLQLALTATLVATSLFCRAQNRFKAGVWQLSYDQGVNIVHNGMPLMSHVKAEYALDDRLVSTDAYRHHRFSKASISDRFGKGVCWTIVYTAPSLPTLTHTFRIYDRYLLIDISLASALSVRTNYMSPVASSHTGTLWRGGTRRTVFVPYDNDAWIRFHSTRHTGEMFRSYEATAVYNPQDRQGVVMGAIHHDQWKNAIDLVHESSRLKAFSGVADSLTRDHRAHGSLHGTHISSATFMVGVFADWRDGLDTYARLNTLVTPPRPWGKAVPVGWNSWGALQFKVNHQNSTEVSRFIADNLQNQSFHNAEGLVYTGLDSGWNSFTESELRDFARQCELRRQVPCIYWTPFTDWAKNPERTVPEAPRYKYKDIYLYAHGKPQELDGAYAIDPTHPAVRAMMEQTADLFRRCGYKYVKMDFMTHGRMEADRWYDPTVTTGTQAYGRGMALLDSIFHDMYLNLSISPIFPSQYAQSRRIACDAWNKMKDTEYTLNATSFGWWVSKVYDFSDADHVVLRDATEGENRARITSSVITGIFITGDDFSADTTAMMRARRYLTNRAINAIADGRSFRPLRADDDRSEHVFVRKEANGDLYVAVFNYGEQPVSEQIKASDLGLASYEGLHVDELWSHETACLDQPVVIPGKDVKVFHIHSQYLSCQ